MSKKHYLYNAIHLYCLALILCLLLPCISACDPGLPLEVENKTGQVISIYVNDYYQFDVEPGKAVKKRTVPMIYKQYIIEAKNSRGEVVYSETIELEELAKIIDKGIRIVIPPP